MGLVLELEIAIRSYIEACQSKGLPKVRRLEHARDDDGLKLHLNLTDPAEVSLYENLYQAGLSISGTETGNDLRIKIDLHEQHNHENIIEALKEKTQKITSATLMQPTVLVEDPGYHSYLKLKAARQQGVGN